MQTSSVDVLVIGGGVVGAATALALSRHDVDVALLEASSLHRPRGSSAGAARIYAPAGFPDDSYLQMGLRALGRWREIEELTGRRLLHPTGVLSFGAFPAREAPALRRAGLTAEELSADEARSRFGTVAPADLPIIFQPDAGVLAANSAHLALLELVRAGGVQTYEHERVDAIADRNGAVEVETPARVWSCRAVVAAAGPWSAGLLAGAEIEAPPLVPTSQTVVYFEPVEQAPRLPALIDYEGDEPYALWEPQGGLKAAFHTLGPPIDPDDPPPPPDPETAAQVADWARNTYPDLDLRVARTETCTYTNAPGERFVLERHGRVVIASACNGQGFQFAPESGERAAALALEAAGATETTAKP